MLSAKDLEERDKMKKDIKKEFYTRVLSQMCRKIDMYYSLGRTECILNIPEYIFGYPSYNIDQMTVYMHRQFKHLGYRTSILSSGLLHVAWGKPPKPKKEKDDLPILQLENDLPSFANLKKAADSLRKKYTSNTK